MRIPVKAWALAALSAGLQVLIFPTPSWTWLSWVALVPLLLALLQRQDEQVLRPGDVEGFTMAQGFKLGYLCGALWYLGSCYWVFHVMNTYGGLPAPVAAGILILFCLYLGLYHGLFAALIVRLGRKSVPFALVVSPFLWVGVELARSRITGFPWDLLGTAQVDNIALTRIAPYTGVYGVSFVIAVVNAVLAAALLARRKRMTIGLAALAAGIGLQALALWRPAESPATHMARLVQQNVPITQSPWTADQFDHTIAELADLSRQPKGGTPAPHWSAAPRLIIWPESPAPFYMNDPKMNHWLSTLATDQDAYVLAGSLGIRAPQSGGEYDIFNSALLISPHGAYVSRYDKIHLVPFGEYVPFQELLFFAKNLTRQVGTFSRGQDRTVFKLLAEPGAAPVAEHSDHAHQEGMTMPAPPPDTGEGYRLGAFICYESVFPDEVRLFALNGAQVFVNISNDGWFGESGAPGQHLNMARMRAIENNRWLLRSTNTGITAAIDPYGRIVASAVRNQRLAINVPYAMVTETTFYTRRGDWFAYACAIISLAAAFIRFRLRAGILR